MQIRLAIHADLPAVLALLRSAALPADDLPDHARNVFVAFDGAELVAVVGLEDHGTVGLLRSLVVADTHRGRGIAAMLCDTVLARAATLGLSDVYLLTQTAESWFARRGWVVLPRDQAPGPICSTRQFAELCPSSAVLMHLHRE